VNDVDLVAAGHAAFTPYVLEQLSSRIGLPPDAIRHVTERAVPGLVAAMMAKSVDPEGARRVFGAIMSAESNARIGTQLHGLTASSHGLKAVERMGHALALGIMDSREIAAISDHIAALTGVPPQAAHALTDIASAVVFGVTRHHVLLEQGNAAGLPGLLAYQWPIVAPWLAEGFAKALGFDSAAAFADTVPQRLVETAAALPQTSEAGLNGMASEGSGAASGPRTTGFAGESAAGNASAPPVQLLKTAPPVEPPPRKRARAWVWGVLVMIVLLIGVIVYGYRQETASTDQTAAQPANATSGTLSVAHPGSEASAPVAPAVEAAASAASDAGVASLPDAASAAVSGSEPDSAPGVASAAASASSASSASQ